MLSSTKTEKTHRRRRKIRRRRRRSQRPKKGTAKSPAHLDVEALPSTTRPKPNPPNPPSPTSPTSPTNPKRIWHSTMPSSQLSHYPNLLPLKDEKAYVLCSFPPLKIN